MKLIVRVLMFFLIISVANAGDTEEKLLNNAAALDAAVSEAQLSINLGPLTACIEKVRAFGCPIVSAIPVVKDVVGALALEIGMSCPK
jgi:hypothetical protein